MIRNFGRSKPLPRRPPDVDPRAFMDDVLRAAREQERGRLSEAVLRAETIPIFLIFCAIWVAVAGVIVTLLWK